MSTLLAESMAAAFRLGALGAPAVRRAARWQRGFALGQLGDMDVRLSKMMMAKSEFDLLVDSQELHDVADALLDAVSSHIDLGNVRPAPAQADLDKSVERLKQARLDLIHRVRTVMPGLVKERRTWSFFGGSESPALGVSDSVSEIHVRNGCREMAWFHGQWWQSVGCHGGAVPFRVEMAVAA